MEETLASWFMESNLPIWGWGRRNKSDIALLYTSSKNSVNSALTYVIADALFVTISLWMVFLLLERKLQVQSNTAIHSVTFGNADMNHRAAQHIYVRVLVQIRSVVLKWISALPPLTAIWIANKSILCVCELFYVWMKELRDVFQEQGPFSNFQRACSPQELSKTNAK